MSKKNTKIASSVGWSFLSRYSNQLLGLVSTLILARLLSPEDFGIVALASIFIGLLLALTDTNIHLYLIRHKEDDNRLFSAVWTTNIIQSVIVSLLMLIGAIPVSIFFETPELEEIIYCLIAVRMLDGFKNVGIFIAQKKLDFFLDFKITFYSKLASVLATITLAYIFQSYWALIFGQIFASASAVFFSYLLHPFRPKFSLYKWREIYNFSKETIPASIAGCINGQIHLITAAKLGTSNFVGNYHVALSLASMTTTELIAPVIRGLAPNFSVLKNAGNGSMFFQITLTLAAYFLFPVGIGISLVSEELVLTLLGDKWTFAGPMLKWLGPFLMILGINRFLSQQFLIILEKERLANQLMWMRTVLMAIAISCTVYLGDYHDIPKGLFFYSLITLPIILLIVSKSLEMSPTSIVISWLPALFSTGIMFIFLTIIDLDHLHYWQKLIAKIAIGGLVYLSCIFALYIIRNKPEDSIETLLIKAIRSRKNNS